MLTQVHTYVYEVKSRIVVAVTKLMNGLIKSIVN